MSNCFKWSLICLRSPALAPSCLRAKTQTGRQLAVRSVPFYAKGIACGDIISVYPDNDRREILFDQLVSVQIFVPQPGSVPDLERLLSRFGLMWETANRNSHFALDVKPETDYAELRSRLIEAKERHEIGLRESAISGRHRAQLKSFP
ncbi:DUF4265 domain-containing protein [Kribbella alba]|uniref:DUF4265 domain-containing protein n=1 Tax=Kribbella alba TaxID=190197 RepID=UPI003CD07881